MSRRRGRSKRSRPQRLGARLLRGILLATIVATLGTAASVAWLRVRAPIVTAFMLQSRFSDPATGRACDTVAWHWVPRSAIAPDVARAVVLAEDQRFLEHSGFDLRSIERAVEARLEGGRLRGASTLTQQVAKNLYLWPGRSLVRKGLEAWLTVWIEALWPKQRILETYLNVAQFGPCLFGVEAAARRFFGRSAAELEAEQAALLATVLPDPASLRAGDPGPYALERSREILALMHEKRDAPWLRRL